MITRTWADNGLKLNRAFDRVGENASDYELQREYIALGGRVIGEPLQAPVTKATKQTIDEVKIDNTPAPTVEVKTVKRGRQSKSSK